MTPQQAQALTVAIELLRKQIADLPLATANNVQQAIQTADDAPRGPSAYDASAFNRNADNGSPLVGGGSADVAKSSDFFNRNLNAFGGRLSTTANVVGGAFGRLLGPLGSLNTFLGSSTSGMSVFNGALSLFANSIGPVVMPVLFTFSVGLAGAADSVSKKLLPSLDSFSRWVLASGLPAMESLANAAGKATQALIWLGDSKLGKLLGGGDAKGGPNVGGQLGAIDRLTGGDGGVKRDPNAKGWDAVVGWEKSAFRGIADVNSAMFGRTGDKVNSGVNALSKLGGKYLFGSETAGDMYGGVGVSRGDGGQSGKDSAAAARKVMAELQLSMGGKASVGSVTGNWSRAQMASLSLSPFQRETLELQRKTLAALEKALVEYEKTGVYTAPGSNESVFDLMFRRGG